jgi:hypothetical protein
MKKTHRIFALFTSSCLLSLCTSPADATGISGQGTWETTLQARDLDGNQSTAEAYYDTDLNITWLADAFLGKSNTFGLPIDTALGPYHGEAFSYDGYLYSSGDTNWPGAMFWIDAMNNAKYLGYDGWRLPVTDPVNSVAYNNAFLYDGTADTGFSISAPGTTYAGSTGSEMAHLFYNTLGNSAYYDKSGATTSCSTIPPDYCLTNSGPFSNIQAPYWSATEDPTDASNAWDFYFDNGGQNVGIKEYNYVAWAVHPGDIGVAIVPLPAAVWLFGSGLIGMIGIARHNRAA